MDSGPFAKRTLPLREYSAHTALELAARSLRQRHGSLRVKLPPGASYATILRAVESVANGPPGLCLPPDLSAAAYERKRQEKKRLAALETQRRTSISGLRGPSVSVSVSSASNTRPIYTCQHGANTRLPRAITQAQCREINRMLRPDPSPLAPSGTDPLGEGGTTPTVQCTIEVGAVDQEDGWPRVMLTNLTAPWDTSTEVTTISDDLLSESFKRSLGDSEPRHVQISVVIQFTNGPLQMDTVAVVVPACQMKAKTFGVVLGQRRLIDSIHTTLVPRIVTVRAGKDRSPQHWGSLYVERYIDANGSLNVYHDND